MTGSCGSLLSLFLPFTLTYQQFSCPRFFLVLSVSPFSGALRSVSLELASLSAMELGSFVLSKGYFLDLPYIGCVTLKQNGGPVFVVLVVRV